MNDIYHVSNKPWRWTYWSIACILFIIALLTIMYGASNVVMECRAGTFSNAINNIHNLTIMNNTCGLAPREGECVLTWTLFFGRIVWPPCARFPINELRGAQLQKTLKSFGRIVLLISTNNTLPLHSPFTLINDNGHIKTIEELNTYIERVQDEGEGFRYVEQRANSLIGYSLGTMLIAIFIMLSLVRTTVVKKKNEQYNDYQKMRALRKRKVLKQL